MKKNEKKQIENIKVIKSISEFLSMIESISVFKSSEKKSLNVFFKNIENIFQFVVSDNKDEYREPENDLPNYDDKIVKEFIKAISEKRQFNREYFFYQKDFNKQILNFLKSLNIKIKNKENIDLKFVNSIIIKKTNKERDPFEARMIMRDYELCFFIIKKIHTDFAKKYKYSFIKKEYEIVFRAPSNVNLEYFENRRKIPLERSSLVKVKRPPKAFMDKVGEKGMENLYKLWYEYEKPSLFKEKDFIENENNIYKDFISSNPQEFENMTTFDILTKMRHYEVPNRLLDVTLDPLLALYFACGENNGSKTIFVYIVNKDNIKYYDSDTVTVLSVLTKLKNEQKKKIKKIVDIFKKSNGEYYKSKDTVSLLYKKKQIKMPKSKRSKGVDKIISIIENIDDIKEYSQLKIKQSKKSKETVKDWFNYLLSNIVSELDWQLKQEIPGWHDGIFELETFTQCYLVKPKMNNPRIVSQSGAFFIYPFEDSDIKKILIEGTKPEINKTIYKIDTNSIMEELDRLNIDSTKYFPDDLVKYKEEITDRYRS